VRKARSGVVESMNEETVRGLAHAHGVDTKGCDKHEQIDALLATGQ